MITMEVDTGAAVSLMSDDGLIVSLQTPEVWLRTYTGECLQVLGQRKVAVCYGDSYAATGGGGR